MQPPAKPRPSYRSLVLLGLAVAILLVWGFWYRDVGLDRNGRTLSAKNECANLVLALNAYFDDYGHLPDIPMPTGGLQSDPLLMNILLGLGPEGLLQNPKQILYYQGSKARGATGQEYGGLLRTNTTSELFDPWPKPNPDQQRHYLILWDIDGDNQIIDPFTGQTLHTPVLTWSTGKDGQQDLTNPHAKVNKDNIYSWK